jgi:hypothetical protein
MLRRCSLFSPQHLVSGLVLASLSLSLSPAFFSELHEMMVASYCSRAAVLLVTFFILRPCHLPLFPALGSLLQPFQLPLEVMIFKHDMLQPSFQWSHSTPLFPSLGIRL